MTFKIQVVKEGEPGELSLLSVQRKYGIRSGSMVVTGLRKNTQKRYNFVLKEIPTAKKYLGEVSDNPIPDDRSMIKSGVMR